MMTDHQYDDIRNVAYPVKTTRPRMSMQERAAQFSPFAALTGYDALIGETARLTDCRIELDETQKVELDRVMCRLREEPSGTVRVTYFLQDDHKSGGAYLTISGLVKKIDEVGKSIVMANRSVIPFEDIISLHLEE